MSVVLIRFDDIFFDFLSSYIRKMLDCHDRITVLAILKTVYTILFIVLVEHIPYNTIIIPSIRAMQGFVGLARR